MSGWGFALGITALYWVSKRLAWRRENTLRAQVEALTKRAEEAEANEREACAKVAEESPGQFGADEDWSRSHKRSIAAAIRARGGGR